MTEPVHTPRRVSLNAMRVLEKSYLDARLNYNPDTGSLTWKPKVNPDVVVHKGVTLRPNRGNVARWSRLYAGKKAFTTMSTSGYLVSYIDYTTVYAHMAAWVMMHGTMPPGKIVFRDGNPKNLRIDNLVSNPKPVVRPKAPDGTEVMAEKGRKRYVAKAVIDGKRKSLGAYATWHEAYRRCLDYVEGRKE